MVKKRCRQNKHDAKFIELTIGYKGYSITFTPTKGEWKCVPSMVREMGTSPEKIAKSLKRILEKYY